MNANPRLSHLNRRSFLQAAGVTLALPILDAMPRLRATEAAPRRLVAIQTNMGILPQFFFPDKAGRDFTLPPYLEELKTFRQQFTVFSGISHPDVDGAHEAEKAFLSATPHPGSASFKSGISLDQFVAERFGPVTRFSSLVLAVNSESSHGMSYTRSGVKIPAERSPAKVYQQMFIQGRPAEVEQRIAELRAGRSLLDFVSEPAKRLNTGLPAADRDRLDQYFTSVRELEQQLQKAEEWERRPKPKASQPAPQDVTEGPRLIDRTRLMFDTIRLAFESDSTRVISLFINTASIVAALPGVSQETHSLTHHGNRPEALNQLRVIETAQFRVFAELLRGLSETRETGVSLLDRTMVLYGTCMGSANSHANTNLPILLAGGGFRHGQHLAFDTRKNYPLPNLFVSMLQRLGLPIDRFASSTGTMRGLDFA